MGLYDTPLPPRPPPKEEDSNSDDDDDPPPEAITHRLFQFATNGREVNGRLPPLQRRLDSGVACYFEATDRLVVNLVDKTGCAVEDACWALEACRGDLTEAWTRISTARRTHLLQQKQQAEDDDYDSDEYDLQVLDEFERRKRKLRDETDERRRAEYLKLSKPDDPWLPTKNPKPIDDEPWFTG